MDILKILNHLLRLILFFYSQPSLPRNVVDKIINLFKNFLVEILFPQLKTDILKACGIEHEDKINDVFGQYEKIFDHVHTEKKIFGLLRERGLIEYELLHVGNTLVPKIIENEEKLAVKEVFMSYVPLRKSLAMFFQLPGIFQKVNNYLDELYKDSSGVISNIVQSDLWANMRLDCKGILIPLYIYYDDFEGGNALGCHAGVNKFGALYTYIACLPPDIASQITSIIFTGLICSRDKKDCSNEEVFKPLIQELNNLRDKGITITVDGKAVKLYFQVVLFLGDNLGLNDMFDMVDSFKDTPFCRACRASSEIWKKEPKEINIS